MGEHYNTIIIGAGFGGTGMAIRLKQRGEDSLLVIEKAGDVGGTWRDNTYPGAACDVPSHLYSYSFEPKFDWSRRFAPQADIHAYLRHCADKYDVRRHVRFDTEVSDARFDEQHNVWQVQTTTGEHFTARFLITATGQLNRPAWPTIAGANEFKGERFHSARWDHGVDLDGKRVAVIGTGASAIQFVPAIAGRVKQLTLFQRSAPWVVPKPDRTYHRVEQQLMEKLPLLQKLDRARVYAMYETRVLAFTNLQRIMKVYEFNALRYLRKFIRDPALQKKLTPDYPIGCKRILISNDYLPALARDNVSVVTDSIERFDHDGLHTRDGTHHPVDVVIYGTGFQATDFLAPMAITGRDGRNLNEVWRDGAEAYLGMTVHGFPNLFMLYGPNTNLGHSSIIYMLESQMNHVIACMDAMDDTGATTLEVRDTVQAGFNHALQARITNSVWDQGCTSWYKTESGKNTNNWPGFTFNYRLLTRSVNHDDYQFS